MPQDLFDWPSRVWSIGPSGVKSLRRRPYRAELHQYVATYNADLATYRRDGPHRLPAGGGCAGGTRVYSQQISAAGSRCSRPSSILTWRHSAITPESIHNVDVTIAQTTLLATRKR